VRVPAGATDAKPATKVAKGYAPGERRWEHAGACCAFALLTMGAVVRASRQCTRRVAHGMSAGAPHTTRSPSWLCVHVFAAKIGATMRAGPGMKISNWSKEEEEAIVATKHLPNSINGPGIPWIKMVLPPHRTKEQCRGHWVRVLSKRG
jgi:hypothetical protein